MKPTPAASLSLSTALRKFVHPPLPLSQRDQVRLQELVKESFRTNLAASTHDPASFSSSSPPPSSSRSSSPSSSSSSSLLDFNRPPSFEHAADTARRLRGAATAAAADPPAAAHLSALLTMPPFAAGGGTDGGGAAAAAQKARIQRFMEDPVSVFVEHVSQGTATPRLACACIRRLLRLHPVPQPSPTPSSLSSSSSSSSPSARRYQSIPRLDEVLDGMVTAGILRSRARFVERTDLPIGHMLSQLLVQSGRSAEVVSCLLASPASDQPSPVAAGALRTILLVEGGDAAATVFARFVAAWESRATAPAQRRTLSQMGWLLCKHSLAPRSSPTALSPAAREALLAGAARWCLDLPMLAVVRLRFAADPRACSTLLERVRRREFAPREERYLFHALQALAKLCFKKRELELAAEALEVAETVRPHGRLRAKLARENEHDEEPVGWATGEVWSDGFATFRQNVLAAVRAPEYAL